MNVATTSGQDTGAKELLRYIAEVQHKATRLSGLLNAVAFLEGETTAKVGQDALILIAEDLAQEVNNALDSVNLPEVTL